MHLKSSLRLTGISESGDIRGCAICLFCIHHVHHVHQLCSTAARLPAGTRWQEGTVPKMPLYTWPWHPNHLKIPQEVGHWIQRSVP